jgi:hypothetical protein
VSGSVIMLVVTPTPATPTALLYTKTMIVNRAALALRRVLLGKKIAMVVNVQDPNSVAQSLVQDKI